MTSLEIDERKLLADNEYMAFKILEDLENSILKGKFEERSAAKAKLKALQLLLTHFNNCIEEKDKRV